MAKLIGADTTMDDDFVQALLDEFSPVAEGYQQLGLFPPAIDVASGAGAQAKLDSGDVTTQARCDDGGVRDCRPRCSDHRCRGVRELAHASASPDDLVRYANSHTILFFAGAWSHATGALLSVLFFMVLVQLSDARDDLAGTIVTVAGALLLAVVIVEAALLIAVPMGAAVGDTATVSTTFTLINGVFARVFPLAPVPSSLAGLARFCFRETCCLCGTRGLHSAWQSSSNWQESRQSLVRPA